MRQARPPEHFERTPSDLRRPAPLLGEHTDEVLLEAGLAPEDLATLFDEGTIARPEIQR